MTSKTHQFKNAMGVYAAELICSTGVSGFQTFKPVFCIYNKLRLHAEMLSQWVNDVIFSRSNPLMSYRSVLNLSNGGPSNPKFTLKINSLRIKRKAQNFASWMLSEYAFKVGRKKGYDYSTTLREIQQNTFNLKARDRLDECESITQGPGQSLRKRCD